MFLHNFGKHITMVVSKTTFFQSVASHFKGLCCLLFFKNNLSSIASAKNFRKYNVDMHY